MKPVPIIGDFAFIPVTWWILVVLMAAAMADGAAHRLPTSTGP